MFYEVAQCDALGCNGTKSMTGVYRTLKKERPWAVNLICSLNRGLGALSSFLHSTLKDRQYIHTLSTSSSKSGPARLQRACIN